MRRVIATRRPPQDVDDVLQEALARAWSRRETYDESRGAIRAWLIAVALDQANGSACVGARSNSGRTR